METSAKAASTAPDGRRDCGAGTVPPGYFAGVRSAGEISTLNCSHQTTTLG
jgi:hypothetical protein